MVKSGKQGSHLANVDVRRLMLQYFYDRNNAATSIRGKKGASVRTSELKSALKQLHGLSQSQVLSNLTYLLSQGWITEQVITKTFTPKGGSVVSSPTSYYQITAAGIDKIDGPGEFTMDRFHGIRIDATGQNIITVGDGNRINAKFGPLGETLAALRNAITASEAEEGDKLAYVADIETIQIQLAKPIPNRGIIKAAWDTVKGAAALNGCATLVAHVAPHIAQFL